MKVKCNNCREIIEGDKKGSYITCRCGLVAIDETPYYSRIIGDRRDYEIIEGKLEDDILDEINNTRR